MRPIVLLADTYAQQGNRGQGDVDMIDVTAVHREVPAQTENERNATEDTVMLNDD